MRRLARRLVLPAAIGIILVAAIMLALRPRSTVHVLKLHFQGYGETTNKIKTATFVVTNPGPAQMEYRAHQEWGPSNVFMARGTLRSGNVLSFQILLSEKPTRLVINYWQKRPLRDITDELRDIVNLPVQPSSSDAVFSDALVNPDTASKDGNLK